MSRQLGKYKKRALVYTEDISEEESDVDMEIEDNDSSGSSVDSDHVPAKRLRTSVATRSSGSTPALEEFTTEVPAKRPRTSVATHSSRSTPALDDVTTEVPAKRLHRSVAIRSSRSTPAGNDDTSYVSSSTEPEPNSEPDVDPDPNMRSLRAHMDPTKDATTHATPAPSNLELTMDVDESGVSHNTVDIDVHRVRKPVNTLPIVPPQQSPLPSEPGTIPDFLIGKHNIYDYLSSVDEPGFKTLLKTYISFELYSRSPIRGTLPTGRRPKAITWWSGRARPTKLPPYDSLKSFANGVVEWWIFVQPRWREIDLGTVSRVGGDWERLYQPGINGLLNIVVLASWWARILKERDSPVDDTYSWFISDVTWVLSQLTSVRYEDF